MPTHPPHSPFPGGNHNQQVSPPVMHALLHGFIEDALTDGPGGGCNTHFDVQVVNHCGKVCMSGVGVEGSWGLSLTHSRSFFLFRRICNGSAALIGSHLGAPLTRSVPDPSPTSAAAAAAHPKQWWGGRHPTPLLPPRFILFS